MNDFWPRYAIRCVDLHGAAATKGESCPNSKLTEREVREIRLLYKNFGMRRSRDLSQRSLAQRYHVHQTVIGLVVRAQTWRHICTSPVFP